MICLCLEKLVRFSGMKDLHLHTFIITCDPLLDLLPQLHIRCLTKFLC